MIEPRPTVLEGHGVRLEPLAREHHDSLVDAARDGELWRLWFTSVPEPEQAHAYISAALAGQEAGHMLPWAVRDLITGSIVGTTRYHDIVTAIDRVEIGYTWYARHCQKTHVNTACKRLLLGHAFDELRCAVVGFRTDNFNFASQQAIAGLGAKQDGVIRHHQPRRDGTVRDTVMYSVLAGEWPDVKRHLELRLARHR
jgi:RimJ/RimL family protein N-acetyltransferase